MPDQFESVTEPASLAKFTTLRVGGPATAVIEVVTEEELIAVVRRLDAAGEPVLLLGGGSNVVISDEGFAGTVVLIRNTDIEFSMDENSGRPYVTAGAGAIFDDVVAASINKNFGGLECFSGIPGSTGAVPVQNVGAYGVEASQVLKSVKVYHRGDRSVRWWGCEELELAYRTSVFKGSSHAVVVAVSLWLEPDGKSRPIAYRELAGSLGVDENERVAAALVRQGVVRLRKRKGMVLDDADYDTWSVGSFFTNPIVHQEKLPEILEKIAAVVGGKVAVPQYPGSGGTTKLSAAWLIERAGFSKGYPQIESGCEASARLSTKHTLALTNRGTATTAEVLALARIIRDGVREKFAIELHPEPVLIGENF